jgi:hypothetical protein
MSRDPSEDFDHLAVPKATLCVVMCCTGCDLQHIEWAFFRAEVNALAASSMFFTAG